MQNINEIIVLVIVFIAVLVCVAVFLPVFFAQKTEVASEDLQHIVDDPVRRFIEPENLQKMRYSSCMIVAVAALALIIVSGFYWGIPIGIAFAFLAYQLPMWNINRKIKKRNELFESGMLDFTILIANTLRAGIALPSAIEMAIQTIEGPIREEFNVVLREHRLGVDLVESIERLNKRIKCENLQLFSATICVTMRTGGSMADVLDHVIETIRQRSAFQDKLKTMISQSEFEALLISCSPFVAFIILYILDRDLMTPMLTTGIGWIAIFGVILLEVIGFIILKKVTTVKF